jgi:RHS repeat-associated protein
VSDITTLEYYRNVSGEGSNRGQLKAIINALGQRTEFLTYDANGNLKKLKDPNGVMVLLAYNEGNRIKSISNLTAEATTTYSYDGRGNLVSVLFPEEDRVKFTYDLGGRLDTVKDALGNKIHYEYDRESNRIREELRDQNGILTKFLDFGYDPYKRLKQIIQPDATFTEYTYNGNGNRTKSLDPRGNETIYTYDPLNRLTQTNEPGSIITGFEYNTQDRLTKVTDANRNATEYRFDDFGRRFETISPDTGTAGYRYDEAGNLTQKTDARGVVVNYNYDPLNRLTSITFPDASENITYVYDDPSVSYGIGRLTGRTDPSGSYTFHYDAQGNLIREVKKVGDIIYRTKYTYNKNNVLTSLIYPTGRKVTYTLDSTGRVAQVTSPLEGRNKVRASQIGYVPFGGVNGFVYGNGLLLGRGYDEQYRTSSITTGSVLRWTYEHDPNGNIISITDSLDSARSQTFGYDPLNRLGSATGIYGGMSYTYDLVGNRWTQTLNESTETYTYESGTNRLAHIDGEQPKTFTYDENSNIDSENDRIYTYNQADRLSEVSEDAIKLGEYVYNGEGQRIKKATQAGTRIFHHDLMGHLIAETDEQGSTQVEYVYLGDSPLAMIDKEGTVYYFHTDHSGTPQTLTDRNRNVVWRADYRPFGETDILTQNVENPFRFPGQYYDKETGSHYNYFRDYRPGIGRYIQPDPIGLWGVINLFTYVRNDPVNGVDPTGLLGPFGPGFKNVIWPAANPYTPDLDTAFGDPSWLRFMNLTSSNAIPGQFGAASAIVGLPLSMVTGGAACGGLVVGPSAISAAGAFVLSNPQLLTQTAEILQGALPTTPPVSKYQWAGFWAGWVFEKGYPLWYEYMRRTTGISSNE